WSSCSRRHYGRPGGVCRELDEPAPAEPDRHHRPLETRLPAMGPARRRHESSPSRRQSRQRRRSRRSPDSLSGIRKARSEDESREGSGRSVHDREHPAPNRKLISMEPKPLDDRFSVLVRLFFSRFFDKESLSPQGDSAANVTQTLGILAAPGGFISLILYFAGDVQTGWNLVTLRCLFLAFSMSVISFIVIFEWDAIFPDRRDYQVLFPLPVPMAKLFLAKMTAFLLFLGMFLIAINGIVTLFWPVIFDHGNYFLVTGTHLLVVTVAGLFCAFAAAAIQGLLLIVVPARIFRFVATCVQTLLLTVMVMFFFISPLIASETRPMIGGYADLSRWVPVYWFSGLYELIRPAVRNQALLHLGYTSLT